MRRLLIIAAICVSAMGAAFSQELTDEEQQNMAKLHNKLVRMKRQMDALMKDVIGTYPDDTSGLMAGFGQDVRIDITEDPKRMTVKADLPGMDKDKIEIVLERNILLKISGTRNVAVEEAKPNMVRQERMQGRFERVIQLPTEGMASGITASYQNGVLEVVIPKKSPTKEDMVKVKVQ
jgi:HSP20 family protein